MEIREKGVEKRKEKKVKKKKKSRAAYDNDIPPLNYGVSNFHKFTAAALFGLFSFTQLSHVSIF